MHHEHNHLIMRRDLNKPWNVDEFREEIVKHDFLFVLNGNFALLWGVLRVQLKKFSCPSPFLTQFVAQSWLPLLFLAVEQRRKREKYFDGIVVISKKLFKLHAFERTVESRMRSKDGIRIKQAVAEHNLWFLLAYLVMVKCLIGNLSNFAAYKRRAKANRGINSPFIERLSEASAQYRSVVAVYTHVRSNQRSLSSLYLWFNWINACCRFNI